MLLLRLDPVERAEREDRGGLPRRCRRQQHRPRGSGSTGQVIKVGGPKEFVDAIEEQRAKVVATAKAINFQPRQ